MACMSVCPVSCISFHDGISVINAEIDESRCISCGQCERVCQVNNPVNTYYPILWKQGWADENIRRKSSSGGAASAIMKQFIERGGSVCSCLFKNGRFSYLLTDDVNDIEKFAGSKYVKSDPSDIHHQILNRLKEGKKVLMIGLPCHVVGMKKFLHGRYEDSFYSMDLICHGTPSVKLLESFLKEYHSDLNDISSIRFRRGEHFGVYADDHSIVPESCRDTYTMGFLKGLFYTENCYSCSYAKTERVSDMTIGDSWGTELVSEEPKGISLLLGNTEKGKELLNMSGMELKDVDLEKAVAANHQLSHPSVKTEGREVFFKAYEENGQFSKAVAKVYPKECRKYRIKEALIKAKILR